MQWFSTKYEAMGGNVNERLFYASVVWDVCSDLSMLPHWVLGTALGIYHHSPHFTEEEQPNPSHLDPEEWSQMLNWVQCWCARALLFFSLWPSRDIMEAEDRASEESR